MTEWVHHFVPKRFAACEFRNYEINEHNSEMAEACKRYVKEFSEETTQGILLQGTVGMGKTHLAIAMGKNLAHKGFWSQWVNFARICIEVKHTWGSKEKFEETVKRPLYSPMLILDDLGAEKIDKTDQGWVSELVYDVIQYRYENMLPTIITTNLNLDALGARYTPRTASRLAEMCLPIWASGYDYRVDTIQKRRKQNG